MTSTRERSPEIETVIDRHLSQQTQLTTVGSLAGPELDSRTQPALPPGVILWDKVLYNRVSTASMSSTNSQRQVYSGSIWLFVCLMMTQFLIYNLIYALNLHFILPKHVAQACIETRISWITHGCIFTFFSAFLFFASCIHYGNKETQEVINFYSCANV